MYCVIIGDIIESKKITNRQEIQIKLQEKLNYINQIYQEIIVSKFIITLGDEFQGVLGSSNKVLEIADRIRFDLPEINFRFGIGLGEITTTINPELSIGADGPAFWNARQAINYIHENNDFKRNKIRIVSESKSDKLINEILGLCGYIESNWVASQKELYRQIIMHYGYDLKIKQVVIANDLNLSTQNLYLRLKKMGYYNYLRSRLEIENYLMEEIEDDI